MSARGGMRARVIKPQPLNSEINITPLVDVVLVLLIIFMVVTPLLEKDIGVRIPATEQVEQQNEVPPDQLVVRLDASGELNINNQRVPESEYVDRLRTVLANKPKNDKLVFIVADDSVNYGKVVNLLDGAKQAGAETIGMMTEIPENVKAPEGKPDQPKP